jgi:hypothetical protein
VTFSGMDHSYQPELWRDLYVMLGTSAAALIGLLFIVASFRLDEIMGNPVYRIRTRNMTIHLLALVVQAALILTPQPMEILGVELLIINLLGLPLPLTFMYDAFFINEAKGKRGAYSIYRGVMNIGGYLLGIVAGANLIAHSVWGMYLITASFIVFLTSALLNAWAIMSVVGQSAKVTKRRPPARRP